MIVKFLNITERHRYVLGPGSLGSNQPVDSLVWDKKNNWTQDVSEEVANEIMLVIPDKFVIVDSKIESVIPEEEPDDPDDDNEGDDDE